MRLIDADELKTAFPASENSTPVLIASVRATINHMPTIEQPEIIRCRECRWWDPCPSSTIAPLYHLCRRVGRMNMTADDFCSRSARREVSE